MRAMEDEMFMEGVCGTLCVEKDPLCTLILGKLLLFDVFH